MQKILNTLISVPVQLMIKRFQIVVFVSAARYEQEARSTQEKNNETRRLTAEILTIKRYHSDHLEKIKCVWASPLSQSVSMFIQKVNSEALKVVSLEDTVFMLCRF